MGARRSVDDVLNVIEGSSPDERTCILAMATSLGHSRYADLSMSRVLDTSGIRRSGRRLTAIIVVGMDRGTSRSAIVLELALQVTALISGYCRDLHRMRYHLCMLFVRMLNIDLIAMFERDSGSSHSTRNDIDDFRVLAIVPDRLCIKLSMRLLSRCSNGLCRTNREVDTLAATRDLLLPKLMSGEIRVKDAEKIAEAAL